MKFGNHGMAALAACSIGAAALAISSAATAAPQKTIKIGIITFLSGPAASTFGVPTKNAATIVSAGVNQGALPKPYTTKGFNGVPIELIFMDEAGGTTKQVSDYRNLVQQQGVDAVIGYDSSGDCLAVAPVAEELKKLTVLFDCGSPRVFEDSQYKYVFRTGSLGTSDDVAAAMYLKARKIKVTKYSGINQNYSWGQDAWGNFSASMKQLYPDATVEKPQFPAYLSGQYGAEISTLLTSGAQVIHSSLWGGDLDAFVVQAVPRGLFNRSKVILTTGETVLDRLGNQLPDGTIIGARGPFDVFAPKSELNDWFYGEYTKKYKMSPNYASYKIAIALLGLKSAYEKAAKDSNGSQPTQDQVISALENLSFETPSGSVAMTLAKGHQAVYDMVYGTVKHENGKIKMTDIVRFPWKEVSPPEGVKSEDWIKSGFKH